MENVWQCSTCHAPVGFVDAVLQWREWGCWVYDRIERLGVQFICLLSLKVGVLLAGQHELRQHLCDTRDSVTLHHVIFT